MIDFESSDDLGIDTGDNIEIITDICTGDVVAFENIGPSEHIMRALSADEIANYKGRKYVVDRGSIPGTIRLTLSERNKI